MRHYSKAFFTLLGCALLAISSSQAETINKRVIALKSDNFELTETDISDLGVGESRTIETDNGKIIDILRTQEGVEIYVDGELLDMGFDEPGLHEEHATGTHVEIICDDDADCVEDVYIVDNNDFDAETLGGNGNEKFLIHKKADITCSDDGTDIDCEDTIIVSKNGAIDLEALHQQHLQGGPHKVVVIKKKIAAKD